MLHGAGSNHRLALRRVFGKSNLKGESDVEATRYFPEWRDIDYIVATPLARGTMRVPRHSEKTSTTFRRREEALSDRRGPRLFTACPWAAAARCGSAEPSRHLGRHRAGVPAPPEGTVDFAPNALNFPCTSFKAARILP